MLTRRKPLPARPDRSSEFSSFAPRPRVPPRVATLASVQLETAQDVPRTKTPSEAEYMGRVAKLGCVVCRLLGFKQADRTEVHHARAGVGLAQRGGNYLTIPLCSECHRGKDGVHGTKARLRLLKIGELDLLDLTIGELFNAT